MKPRPAESTVDDGLPSRHLKQLMRSDGQRKRELIYETAMALFREHGFEATTMRAIAKAAKISLGSAYHYYPSKVAIVFDYYGRTQTAHEASAAAILNDTALNLDERIIGLMKTKLDLVCEDRALLGHIAATLVSPGNPLSAFAPETEDLRLRSIHLFAQAIEDVELGEFAAPIATLLWVAHLGMLLYLVHDESPRQERTVTLIETGSRQLTALLMLAKTPFARPMIEGLFATLRSAKLLPESPRSSS